MTQLLSSSSRFDWKPCQKTRPWSLLCCKNRSRIHTGSQSCLYRGLLILANLHMSNTECWRLSEDWRRNHIQATSPEEPRLKITKWHYLKSPLNSIFNLKCCLNNDEMFCFFGPATTSVKRKHAPWTNCDSLCAFVVTFSYLNFQQQIHCKKSFCALQNEAEGVADDREWSEPIHIIGQFLALALLNRGLKYISTTTLFRRIYSVSSSESAKTPTIHVERIAVRQFPYINKQLTFLTNFCCCDHQEFFLLGVIFLSYK